LGARIAAAPDVELAAPVGLNIVCFRFADVRLSDAALDEINAAIVIDVQESGIAVPSSTFVDGRCAIRLNLTNHRVTDADLDLTLEAIVASGRRLAENRAEIHVHA